jgi:hypothetical protein
MTPTAKALLAFLVVCLVIGAWMGRFEVRASGTGGSIVLDRWTGRVYWCVPHRADDESNQCAASLRLYP